ncbi:hypothetical protein AB0H98_16445 [Nocardia salmonicida]|uniref:hypothetical protein n=1 Tax=Nocardia salmonicida TaxID=53431 RepID=UPI0034111ED2
MAEFQPEPGNSLSGSAGNLNARGTAYNDVTQYTFRRTVATLIAEGADAKTAAKQLGQSREAITERHYIASAELAPDSSAVLQKGLGRDS